MPPPFIHRDQRGRLEDGPLAIRCRQGFTLIELLVVMAIIATLLSIAAPKYFDSVDRAKEAALHSDLRILREAIDKFHADTGQYPSDLQQLAQARYLQSVPIDPETDRADTWIQVAPVSPSASGVYDVHSGSPNTAKDGSKFSSW